MTNPYRAMCAELIDAVEQARQALEGWANYGQWVWPESALEQAKRNTTEALASFNRARALLAQPEPVAPTDEEIMELMPQQTRDDLAAAACWGVMRIILNRHAVDHARAVLAKWGRPTPQPVAVSERLPGPADPITPPDELLEQWLCSDDYLWGPLEHKSITITANRLQNVATQAANWGGDQELEACCVYIGGEGKWFANPWHRLAELRTARRPKPPSLKAQPVAEGPTDEELLRVAATAIAPYEISGITPGEYEPETECVVEAYGSELIAYAREVLHRWGHPTPQPETNAFAIVQQRLEQLAGDQELMIYRWPNGEWSIDHTNPTSSVQLGEVSGEYGCTGRTLEEAVRKLAELLPTPEATND